ncbi:MAG TPA: DinB family protein [Candidatus Acidoferrales bacterium]
MNEIKRIVDQMDRAMNGEAWHGPHLEELLQGVSAAQAAAYPIPGAHSIWELANHIAAWNLILASRASGTAVQVTTQQDWPPVTDTSAASWTKALENLRAARARLRGNVEKMNEAQLDNIAPGKDHTLYVMLHGGVQHDLYHAGQIAILKKALK